MTYFTSDKLWYLATPYTSHPEGLDVAYRDACEQAGFLMKEGIPVFCPIAHSHGINLFCDDLPHEYEVWLGLDRLFMDACTGLIVCHLPGWDTSKGIFYERGYMNGLGRPIVEMEPFENPWKIK